ncbi:MULTISPECIES: hypothetical protein [unclassified Moraxella]|uniref:hypothetical protein n=1 Tax=unclassified Moraxella TaxID=2685852 RepID=UPI003AF48B92
MVKPIFQKSMIGLICFPLVCLANPTVPKQFQGLWVYKENGATCKNFGEKFIIDAKGTHQLEQSCSPKKIHKQSKTNLTADWACMEEGEEYIQSYTMTINKKHELLRSGGALPLRYCGLPPNKPYDF